ncbi:hypothetical protein HDU87_001594 [Geranomyces variabilis]|uniref:Coiled-coil domain-containing protein 189 n=1 Tax=Geranomyces variabilis TaxID=109894 RepID=A0AAD5TMV1_9FUNG|nr:hypothetical protein HDU87_001594 [Geranomyces variabilis]
MTSQLAWKHLSMQQVYDFYSISPAEEALRYLVSILDDRNDDAQRSAILMDFYFYALRFAKTQNLSPEQASIFFSMIKATHERAAASPFIHLEADYQHFKDTLLRHSVHRPPFSQKVFSLAQVRAIDEYAVNTYFRHYLMYKYAFTNKLRLNLKLDNDEVAAAAAAAAAAKTATGGEKERADDAATAPDGEVASGEVEPAATSTDAAGVDKPEETKDAVANDAPTVPAEPAAEEQQQPVAATPATEPKDAVAPPPAVADEPEPPRPTIQEIAAKELAAFVTSTLQSKMDELRKTLLARVQQQEDQMAAKIKRVEDKDGSGASGGGADDSGGSKSAAAKGKDTKAKKK